MTNDYNINQHTAKKHEVTMYYQRNNEGKADLKLKKNPIVLLPFGTTTKFGFPRFRYLGMSLLPLFDPAINDKH